MAKDIFHDNKFDYSNISDIVKNSTKGATYKYTHFQNYLDRSKFGGENLLWPGTAFRVLQDVNKSLNSRLTDQQIQDMMRYYGFAGSLFGKF
ncbi:MAG: hypothetical protein KBB71_11865 [Lentimicrobiaceae bacterium]|nr:hypothetical protein [Lentimicrobiaceae bacterium]